MKVILLILGVCLILSSPAFASGVNIHLNNDDDSGVASNSNGNALPVASLVQLIRIKRGGSITGRIGQTADAAPPDPGKANWVDSEEQEFVANFTVGQGTGNVGGTFDVAFPAATGDHFLRVWEANALQAGAKYQDIYTPASGENVLFPLDVYVQDFETGISAAAPPAPEVNITIPNVVSFDLDSGAFEQTMTATVNLSVGDEVKLASIDGGQYRVQYIKEADWDAGQGWDSADVTSVDGDGPTVSLPNLTPGTEYRVRAFARNHFVGNNPNWSAVENIETPAAPATGGFAPTNVAVAINDDGSVNLSWNLAGADAAVIEKSTDRGKTWARGAWKKIY